MELTEDTIGIWYVEGDDRNWMLTLFHKDGIIKGIYRWRYYKDDKAFDSKDQKSWYSVTCDRSKEEAIDSIRKVAALTSEMLKGPITEILRGNKSYEDFFAEFMNQEFVSMSIADRLSLLSTDAKLRLLLIDCKRTCQYI